MTELPEGVDSLFRMVVICSQRAEQLIRGARPRVESKHTKPTLIALEEFEKGLVPWRIVSREELEAEQRAILEELKAAMEEPAEAPAAQPEPEEERDAELERLHKLFGMALEAHRELLEEEEEPQEVEEVSLEEAALEDEAEDEPEEE